MFCPFDDVRSRGSTTWSGIQEVEVDHTYGPDDLVAAGRDTECKALSN
jgi:hypothetical protein